MIEYTGYVASGEFDDSAGRLHGRVLNSGPIRSQRSRLRGIRIAVARLGVAHETEGVYLQGRFKKSGATSHPRPERLARAHTSLLMRARAVRRCRFLRIVDCYSSSFACAICGAWVCDSRSSLSSTMRSKSSSSMYVMPTHMWAMSSTDRCPYSTH